LYGIARACNNGAAALNSSGHCFDNLNKITAPLVKDTLSNYQLFKKASPALKRVKANSLVVLEATPETVTAKLLK
jgi:hypothetical protein